jgi:hypothetical protein
MKADDELPKVIGHGEDGFAHLCERTYQSTADTVCEKKQLRCHLFEWPDIRVQFHRRCPKCWRLQNEHKGS